MPKLPIRHPQDLWQRRHAPIARHRHPGQAYRTSLALAEWRAERLIGSIRRECVDHIIVFGRDAFASGPEILRRLLQLRQNASIIEEGCAGFSPGSANR
jgi:hypothetical protein